MTELRSKYHVVRKAQLLEKAVQRSDHYNKKLAAKFSHPTDLVIFFVVTGAPENVEKAQAEISELVKTFKLNKRSRYSPRENNNLPETLGKKGIGLCHEWV